MSDVAISYSSSQRRVALRVAQHLRAAGRTIWLDDASEVDDTLAAVGVPVGQPHWDVIAAAIDDALVLLVLDSPAWRASGYCRREYAHARARGKPIVVVPTGEPPPSPDPDAPVATWEVRGLDDLAASIEANERLLGAHARLLRAHLRDEGGSTVGLWRLPLGALVSDAELVFGSDPQSTGITVTEEIVAFTDRVQQAHRRRHRATIAGGSAVLVLIAALATTALIARSAALESELAATAAASTQQSLQVAAEALRAETTANAQELASEALQLASSEAAVAASRQIAAEVAERRRLRLDDPVAAVALSDDGAIAAFGVGRPQRGFEVVAIDVERGIEMARFDVAEGFRGRLLEITPDAGRVVFVGDDTGELLAADLATGSVRRLEVGDFTALAIDDRGRLWWSRQDGRVLRSPSLDTTSDAVEIATVGGRPTALAVRPSDDGFEVLLEGDEAIAFERFSGRDEPADYRPVSTERLFEDFGTGVAITDRDAAFAPDRLFRCGTSLAAVRAGRAALATPTDTFPVTGPMTQLTRRASRLTGHACVGDAVVAVQFRGRPVVVPEQHWVPPDLLVPSEAAGANVLATSRFGDHLIFSRPSGLTDVIRLAASRRSVPVDAGFVVAPLDGLLLQLDDDGVVRSRSPGDAPARELGRLASPPQGSTPLVLGDVVIVGTRAGVSILDPGGVRAEFDLGTPIRSLHPSGAVGAVAAGATSLYVIEEVDTPSRPAVVELQDVETPEAVSDMAVGGDGVAYVTTNLGRLLSVDLLTGETRHARNNSPALSDTGLIVLPDHPDGPRVLTHGSDGILRVFDADLQQLQQVLLPGSGRTLQLAPDGQTILVGTAQGQILLLDAHTLEVVQRLAEDRTHVRSYLFAASGREVLGIELVPSSAGEFQSANRLDILPVRLPPVEPDRDEGPARRALERSAPRS